jgi:crotonobetainyl-CoA:carnitine CoA-transferase CaiB-like acyl-CoA transferase
VNPPAGLTGALSGIRVLDLSRILAGPTCTQLLADLGADVIKIERPGIGDDTRKWGPPYVLDSDGNDTSESSYYLCANRNKRSLTLDIAHSEGQTILRRLAVDCDILVENFKAGGLANYGLGYADLKEEMPGLIYCSITGFGQTGPYAKRAGYDFLVQAMGGIMSITGPARGDPHKVGVGIADVMCGMYAVAAILAALHHREKTGQGQHIDLSLLDSQIAWLINAGTMYLTSGEEPARLGNGHPNIVPYDVFPTADGYIALAVGNDAQYQRFCDYAGIPELAENDRYATNDGRVRNRRELMPELRKATVQHPTHHWLEGLARIGVPCGPVNTLAQAFADPQVQHREMTVSLPHPRAGGGQVRLIANPIKFSETPVSYHRAPPTLGQHTDEVLAEMLDMPEQERDALRRRGVI